MVFNAEKCKVIHFEHENKNINYATGGMLLESVDEEGVIVQNSLQVDKQYAKAIKSANSVLGTIRRSFINKHKEIILPLHK